MKNFEYTTSTPYTQNTLAALRIAFGPGFQSGGPSDTTLRLIAEQTKH
jgi:hypothetical protein